MSDSITALARTCPAEFEFLEVSKGIEAYRLRENGLQVLMYPLPVAPVVTCMITYLVGSRNETQGLTGATHMLEHLMFKGTEKFNKRRGTSIFQVLQRVGAMLNATTWLDRTNYYELLPREHLGLAIEIEADRMRNALISKEDVESERQVILNEMDRGENDPIRNLYQGVWSTAFWAHTYHHPTIGWRSDVEQMTAEKLRHFYDTYYWPNNATVSIIGDFDRGEVFDLLLKHFGPVPAAPHPIPELRIEEPVQRGPRRLTVRQAGEVGAVLMGFKIPRGLDREVDALDVLCRVLGEGKTSRLYRALVDTGLAASVWASAFRLRDPGLLHVFALLAPGRTHAEVEETIWAAIRQVQEEGITEEELIRARNQIRAAEAFGRDGPYLIAAQLNEAIAAGDWRLYTTYLERIERVTRADVQAVAVQYLREQMVTTGYYEPLSLNGANGKATDV